MTSGLPQSDNTAHGSHWVTLNFQDSSTHGGYPDANANKNTTAIAGEYIHRGPWSGSASGPRLSSGTSRYSSISSGVVVNYEPGAAGTIDNTAGNANNTQIICESCHSIVKNIGPKKLLAQAIPNHTSVDNGASLCIGCHADMRTEVNNEPRYFDDASGAQDHHRNAGPTVTGFASLYTGTSTLGAGSFSMNQLDLNGWDNNTLRYWSIGPGELSSISTTERDIIVGTVNVTNGVETSSSGDLHCQSCHRAHNAVSSTGSLIVQRGSSDTSFGLLTTGDSDYSTHGWVQNQRLKGTPTSSSNKLISDEQGLCIGCHTQR
jgi:hypothetical protein